jgi:hypothetical protein
LSTFAATLILILNIFIPDLSSVQNFFVENNHTEELDVRNGSVFGSYNASFLICNSDFSYAGADTISFFSDAHIFSFLTLYKQSKKIIDLL